MRRPVLLALLASAALIASGSAHGLEAQELARRSILPIPSQPEKPFAALSRAVLAGRDSLVQLSKDQVGLRYRLGAVRPGVAFDCSGLVKYVMGLLDLHLPRTAAEQAKLGIEVPRDTAQLIPGDLLFFGNGRRVTHIGIYVGDGKYIHAANRRKGVIESDITRVAANWWKGARRVFVQPDSFATLIGGKTGS